MGIKAMKAKRIITCFENHVAAISVLLLAVAAVLFLPDMALAHDCSGPQDCEQTAGYNAVISMVGAVSAVLAGVLGSTVATGTTIPSVIAGTTPIPGARDDDVDQGGGAEGGTEDGAQEERGQEDGDQDFNELPSDSDGGWEVTDGDGKVHIFETKEDADGYYENLVREMEKADAREQVERVESDYRNAAEHVEFIRSIVRGLQNSGRDASEHIRELERYISERDRLRGEVGKAGGDTDYTPRKRSDWRFGEHDELIRQQKDSQQRFETINKMSDAIERLRDKGIVGENRNLTNKMLERLETMSDNMVWGDKPEPSWEDIQRLKNMIRGDMDATSARNEANDSNWVREGAEATAREAFTGINSEGETSYKGMALRGLLAAGTGGQSEIPMEVIEKTYGMHDDVMAGKSGTEAFTNAVKRVVADELVGRVVEGGLNKVGGAAGGAYNATLKDTKVGDFLERGADKVGDVLQTDVGKALRGQGDNVSDGLRPRTPRTPEPDLTHGGRNAGQRQADFEAGRTRGSQKVDQLEDAMEYRRNNPDAPDADTRLRDAVDDVQTDKHAMHELNSRGGEGNPNDAIEGFNRELKDSYETAHQSTRQRIADEYGVPIEDVKVVKPTNAPGGGEAADPRGFARRPDGSVHTDPSDYTQTRTPTRDTISSERASFDQDVTVRVRQDNVIDPRTGKVESGFADVRQADTNRIYNEEFYKARHDGDLPTRTNPETGNVEVDTGAVNKYADDMDQACTDRLDAEAYGNGDRDLQTAVQGDNKGRAFDDVEGVGKTMEHKQYEWQKRAETTRAEANALETRANTLEADGRTAEAADMRTEAGELHSKAEAELEEGYRQTTKQMHNQIEARVDALNEAHGRTVAEVPPRLEEAVEIMENPTLSPVEVEQRLGELGYTPDKVVQQMSSNLESLQKFEPPPGFDLPPTIDPPTDFDMGDAFNRGVKGAARSGPGPGGE